MSHILENHPLSAVLHPILSRGSIVDRKSPKYKDPHYIAGKISIHKIVCIVYAPIMFFLLLSDFVSVPGAAASNLDHSEKTS